MTKNPEMKCPVVKAAAIVGSPWTALIMRDLLLNESCRFQDLINSVEGINPRTLSQRLKMLEQEKVVEKRLYEDYPPRSEYVLTKKGLELGPVIKAMRVWGDKYS